MYPIRVLEAGPVPADGDGGRGISVNLAAETQRLPFDGVHFAMGNLDLGLPDDVDSPHALHRRPVAVVRVAGNSV